MENVSSSNGIEKRPKLRFAEFTDAWQITSLSNLGSFTSGTGFPEKYQGNTSLDVPFYKVSDMNLPRNTKYMLDVNNTVNDSIIRQLRTRSIDTPSIVFAKVGAAIFGERKRIVKHRFLIDNNMMAFTPNNKIDLEFCHACFYRTKLSHYTQIGALPSYNASDLSIINFGVPSMEEQRKIAKFIILIDNKIEKYACLVEHLKKYKRGVIQAVFDEEKHDLFGEISSGKQVKLSDLIYFQNGINADASKYGRGVRYISVSDILKNNFITYDKIIGQVDIDSRALATYSVTYGDVLFQRSSETREDAGRSNVYLDTEKTATFGGFVIRGKKKSNYDPLYLKYALDSFVVRKQIMQCAAGAQHINVSQEDLCNVVVNLPNIDVQNRISKFIADIDLRITSEEKKANAQVILKKALLQQLFI